jgi:hypothetical protein
MPDAQAEERPLYESVEAMLQPGRLSALTGLRIASAQETPLGLQESAYSGSAISQVNVSSTSGAPARFLLKRVSPEWDYFMRVTGDDGGREALAWTCGLLDRLPPEMGHAYIACSRDGAGWAILMRDVSATLLSAQPDIGDAEHLLMLGALAAFHVTFWDDPRAARVEDGFNDPANYYRVISPGAAGQDPDPSGVMPRIVRDGWQRLPDILGAEMAAALLALANDPRPLRRALALYPQTVTHGDMRAANLGLERGEGARLLVLDWALVGREVPGLDVVWYLVGPGGSGPIQHDESIEHYRRCLSTRLGARFDMAWWQPMLDLSLLGGLIRYGWIASRAMASNNPARRVQAQADLAWLVPGARRGLALLG